MSNFTTFEQLIIQNTISAMKDLFDTGYSGKPNHPQRATQRF
jgi:hypothetical protein